MTQHTFFRVQMEIVRQPDGTFTRPILQLCWHKPLLDENNIPIPPYVTNGITDIVLEEHPELQALVESATNLAVPIALEKIASENRLLEESTGV